MGLVEFRSRWTDGAAIVRQLSLEEVALIECQLLLRSSPRP